MTERKCFVFKFADVEVRERDFLLIKAGERIAVEPKAFRVLLFLLRNPGRLIPKDEIVESVWIDSAVSDNSLTRSIAQLRRVLGDDSREPLYILTVPTVGYRFLCEVIAVEDGFGSQPAETDRTQEAGRLHQATVQSNPAPGFEERPRQSLNIQLAHSRRTLFAGLVATLFLLVVGFLVHRAIRTRTGLDGHADQYPLIEQRVTSNPPEVPVRGAVVSPDGKYVAYADSTGLYLRQMSTGETRPWSLPKGFVAWPNSWFPDGTHLLVQKLEWHPQHLDLWQPSLYKLSLLGGEPQKLMDDAFGGSVSPDGAHIAYLARPNMDSEIWVMDSDGASARRIISADASDQRLKTSWFLPPVWSPNGQRLACIEGHANDGSNPVEPTASLLTIKPNGSGLSQVLNDSSVGQALWWAADGRVLFAYREDAANKKDNLSVYSIRIDERTGNAAGAPQPITQGEGSISSLSGTADGKRLLLLRTNEPVEAFIAKFDARSRQFKEPRRLTLDENENIATAWTSDSKAILFISNRNGSWTLFKQSIDQTTPEALVEAPSIVLPRLSPDGSQVLYLSTSKPDDASIPASLMIKPLAGGPPHLVLQEKGINNYGCARAPSERCVFSKLIGKDLIFVAFDPEYGKRREILSLRMDLRNWVISPDGSKIAIVLDRHTVRFRSLDTEETHDATVKDWPLNALDWSADSRTVIMPSATPNGIPVVLEVDQTGKARVVLQGNANTGFGAMIPSPDGQYGLIEQQTPAENNAWMVDNF